MKQPSLFIKKSANFLLKIIKHSIYQICKWWLFRFKKSIVIGSRYGTAFNDNSKFFYEYIVKNRDDINITWITKSKIVYDLLKSKGYPVAYSNSIKGHLKCLFASIAITSFAKSDIDSPFTGGIKWIMLFHSILIKNCIPSSKSISKPKSYNILGSTYNDGNFDYMLITSDLPELISGYGAMCNINDDNFIINGYPRNDIFNKETKYSLSTKFRISYEKKYILYAPTFREWVKDAEYDLFYQYDFNIEILDNFLSVNNLCLIISYHPNQKIPEKLISEIKKSDSIVFSSEFKNLNVQELLILADILVTDYSGIYIDYLLLEKPIIFTTFDIDKYRSSTGFAFDYDDVTPGPKAQNWIEVHSCLEDLLINQLDRYSAARTFRKNYFHKYTNGNYSAELVSKIFEGYNYAH
jgi:CDP-glycerol glycerophosphotransferase (TagB/SpsB family)